MKEKWNIKSNFLPVIDSHAHIYPNTIAEKAKENVGEYYGLPMYTSGTLSELYKVRKENYCKNGREIVGQVIFSPATTPKQVESINNFIANLCSIDKTLYGFGTIHPDYTDWKKEIGRISSLGLIGIKFHSDFQKFNIDDDKMWSIYKEIAEKNIPVLFHIGDEKTNYSSVQRLIRVLERIPKLTVIVAHMGGYLHWQEAYECLPVRDNLYFDTSSTLKFVTSSQVTKMLDKFGEEHFFFGSDFPMWNPNYELCRLDDIHLPEQTQRKIEYENVIAFLNKYRLILSERKDNI